MNDEPRYIFTLSEFRRVYKGIFTLGMKAEELDIDPAHIDNCCDGWLEANGDNFQLENEQKGAKEPCSALEVLDTGLGDDIESDKDAGPGFFTPENPVFRDSQ
mgnify:CR=1 FL=1